MEKFIYFFNETGLSDIAEVGIKNALLGEMHNNPVTKNIPVPNGFALTMASYKYFLQYNKLEELLEQLMNGLNNNNLEETGLKARHLVMAAKFPPKLESEIIEAYRSVSYDSLQEVAVRSSTNEYYSDEEFWGYDSYLNIKGNIALAYAIKCCFASVYSDKAIMHRCTNRMPHDVAIAVSVQLMVRSDLAGSGTIYISDAKDSPDNLIIIQSVWGLGNDKGETIIPDEYRINDSLTITKKHLGDKSSIRVYNDLSAGINTTSLKITPPELRIKFVLDDEEVLMLAQWASIIGEYFNKPLTIKWAKDGLSARFYIVGIYRK